MMVDCLKFPSQIITRSTSSSVTSSARRSSCVSRHGFANMHALARREPRHAARRKPVEEFHGRARIGAARVRIPDLRGKKFKEAIGGALSGGDTSHGQITGYIDPDKHDKRARAINQGNPSWRRLRRISAANGGQFAAHRYHFCLSPHADPTRRSRARSTRQRLRTLESRDARPAPGKVLTANGGAICA
jgi:hypothetical protein